MLSFEKIRVKCLDVTGESADEFDDLVGTFGKLRIDADSTDQVLNWFMSDNGGDVNFTRKKVTEKDGIIKVFTRLGNIFKFQVAK